MKNTNGNEKYMSCPKYEITNKMNRSAHKSCKVRVG